MLFVQELKLWVLLHGLCIHIRRQRTHTMACFVTLVLVGTNFTFTAWLNQTLLCMLIHTGCIIGYYGLGLAVHWIQNVLHHLGHRLLAFLWYELVSSFIFYSFLDHELVWTTLLKNPKAPLFQIRSCCHGGIVLQINTHTRWVKDFSWHHTFKMAVMTSLQQRPLAAS